MLLIYEGLFVTAAGLGGEKGRPPLPRCPRKRLGKPREIPLPPLPFPETPLKNCLREREEGGSSVGKKRGEGEALHASPQFRPLYFPQPSRLRGGLPPPPPQTRWLSKPSSAIPLFPGLSPIPPIDSASCSKKGSWERRKVGLGCLLCSARRWKALCTCSGRVGWGGTPLGVTAGPGKGRQERERQLGHWGAQGRAENQIFCFQHCLWRFSVI